MKYKVLDRDYYNITLALDAAKSENATVQFDYFDDIIQNIDWSVDYLNLSWNSLLAARAQEIRNKSNKVRLWFSGGRDSFLALKAFVQNSIFIDELVVMEHPHRRAESPAIVEWLQKHYGNLPVGKITVSSYEISDYYQKFSKHWGESERLGRVFMLFSTLDFQRYILGKFQEDGTSEVMGIDKPRLFLGDGYWHSYMVDTTVDFMFGTYDLEPFFISKTVPIFEYQTQHCMRYIEQNVDISNSDNFNKYFFAPCKLQSGLVNPYWEMMCAACLRTEYIHPTTGYSQGKVGSENMRLGDNFYSELEQEFKNHHESVYTSLVNGVLMGYNHLEEFYSSENIKNQHTGIMSKPIRIRKCKSIMTT